ncbi:hypothetical protein C8D87_113145 [Lentzea atacamensis]|uniref:ATP-binding protein n=2 Tax=Lentzea TaxID=165301 RepID=A0ABX9DWQ6_9PSEU|nr:hypothetical protein [Lentzea atacamensis]RAS59839.1 hypothetical protein C8D87_113145 [Lentzea atacamensis]
MSRSGLFRAAALLAAGAAPLLAGSASAVEAPALGGGVPEVGADKLLDATKHANPLDSVGGLQLGHIQAPVAGDVQTPVAPRVPAAQERSVPNPLAAELGTLPALPNAEGLVGNAQVGGLKAPSLSDLPTNGVVPNPNVLSGTLPTING